jgi:hypothetical protein
MMRGRGRDPDSAKTQILADCRPSIVCKVVQKIGTHSLD